MEVLTVSNLGQGVAISFAYGVAAFPVVRGRSKYTWVQHWLLVFLVYSAGLALDTHLIANIAIVSVTALFIGFNHGVLKGLNYAITIFALFQWGIAFLGSLAFLITYHGDLQMDFRWAFSFALVGMAALLKVHAQYFFKNTGRKILLLDVFAKMFFVGFLNAFLPRFFPALGMYLYSVLALSLLVVSIMVVACIQYVVLLERRMAAERSQLNHIIAWANRTVSKYMALEFPEFVQLQQIEAPVIKALMYEFIDTVGKKGYTVKVDVKDCTGHIGLDDSDLFHVINELMTQTIDEATLQKDNTIHVHMDGHKGFFFQIKHGDDTSQGDFSRFSASKDALVALLRKNRHCDITIDITSTRKLLIIL